jgi:hypothetical protein
LFDSEIALARKRNITIIDGEGNSTTKLVLTVEAPTGYHPTRAIDQFGVQNSVTPLNDDGSRGYFEVQSGRDYKVVCLNGSPQNQQTMMVYQADLQRIPSLDSTVIDNRKKD